MSTEATTEIAAPGDAAQQQTAQPGQEDAALAQQQEDASEQGDQSQGDDGGEKLTDEQKTIRKLQRRIDRLTAGRGAATREAELLREQMAQLQQKPQAQEDDRQAIDPQEIDRLANERAQLLHRRQSVATRANAVLEGGKKLPGFDQAVNAVAEEVPFTDRRGVPTPFIEAVLDADKPAELLHWLGNNPDEAAAFANLSPAQIGRRLAKLEDRIEREAKASSKAPPPLTPVRGVGQPAKSLQDLDGDDFDKRRREMIAKRR